MTDSASSTGSAAAPDASTTVRLTDDVEWISECYPIGDRHLHVSLYLIRATGGNIVVDSGSFYHRESIESRLTAATRGQGIQALILSHSDYPHSGNIPTFRGEWGDFEIVASCADAGVQGLPYARRSRIGETLDVLGREFTFLDPPLADRSHTTWIYDRESRVMFVADGFGNYHEPGACRLMSSELPEEGRELGVADFHRGALKWLRYVDPPRLSGTLRRMLDEHPVTFVAPIHGNPIAAAGLEDYLSTLETAVSEIAAAYTVPTAQHSRSRSEDSR
jgi:flavorubredoxin